MLPRWTVLPCCQLGSGPGEAGAHGQRPEPRTGASRPRRRAYACMRTCMRGTLGWECGCVHGTLVLECVASAW
eukprot:194340-Chlamydomonas_euryale.AAC.2